eukprot:148458_1
MSRQVKPVALQFISTEGNELIISYLFRTNRKGNDESVGMNCPKEVCALISSLVGSLDNRVPFWNKYAKTYLQPDTASVYDLDMARFGHGSQLQVYFCNSPISTWPDWVDVLSLNIDGSYSYKFEELWGGFAMDSRSTICEHYGKWEFDDKQSVVVLIGIGYHLQKDYRACGGSAKLKEKEQEGGKSRIIFATIDIQQCLKAKRIEFIKVEFLEQVP